MHEPVKPTGVVIAICGLILIGGALSLARSVFAPITFALFIIALVWPFQSRLQAAVPKILALAISIIVTTVIITAFGSMIAWGFSRAVQYVINDAARSASERAVAVSPCPLGPLGLSSRKPYCPASASPPPTRPRAGR